MKAFKTIMNVLGIIVASILSIVLIVVLNTTLVVSAATSFFEGKNIHKLLSNVDYSQIITSEMGTIEDGEIPAIGNDLINQLMETEMMKEIIEMCVNNVFEVMEGTSEKDGLTADEVFTVAEKHLDELSEILKLYIGDTIPLTEETLKEMALSIAKEYSVVIAEMMPTAEDLGLDAEVLNIIMNLRNGTYFWIVFGVAAGLTLVVMLCQVMRFKGFMWIGVDYLVAAVISLIASVLVKTFNISALLGDSSIGVSILSAMTGIISAEMMKGTGILAILGVIFIVVFILGRKLLKKKNVVAEAEIAGI